MQLIIDRNEYIAAREARVRKDTATNDLYAMFRDMPPTSREVVDNLERHRDIERLEHIIQGYDRLIEVSQRAFREMYPVV